MVMGIVVGIVGALVAQAAISLMLACGVGLRRRKSPEPRPEPVLDTRDEFDIHVETLFVPPSGDWTLAIQQQLDAVERTDKTAILVAATNVNGRIVLFYRRKKA